MNATNFNIVSFCVTLFLTLQVFVAEVRGQSATDLFLNEYPAASKRMGEIYKNLTITGKLSIKKIPAKLALTQDNYDFLYEFLGDSSKWEEKPLASSTKGLIVSDFVWCRNSDRYVFKLKRPVGAPKLSLSQFLPKDTELSSAFDGTSYRHIKSPFAINGTPLTEIMNDSSFSVKLGEFIQEGQSRLVHIQYAYSPTGQTMLRDGEVWLDPQHEWLIKKSQSDYLVPDRPKLAASMESETDYDYETAIAQPIRTISVQKLGNYRAEETFVYTSFFPGKASSGDFTLTHYGLPEIAVPLAKANSRSNTFVFVNIVIVASLAGLLLWRYYVKRPKAFQGDCVHKSFDGNEIKN